MELINIKDNCNRNFNVTIPDPVYIHIMKSHGWEMLHNSDIYSKVYGPVSIYQGLPYYYNGHHAIIIGYDIENTDSPVSEKIKSFINEFVINKKRNLITLEYWGANEVREMVHPDFHCTEKRTPNYTNSDIILKLNEISYHQLWSYRFVRKAINNGLKGCINIEKSKKSQHQQLVDMFLMMHPELASDEREYIDKWSSVLDLPNSKLIDVYFENELCGFLIVNFFLETMPTYAYGFFNNQISGTSDLAHALMINECKKQGFHLLDLGYSINKNLFRYKTKWGSSFIIKSPWNIFWKNRKSYSAALNVIDSKKYSSI